VFPFQLKYLATGTGHCGTGYTAKVLCELGILCGHEAVIHHDGKICDNPSQRPEPWGHKWEELQAESSWGVTQDYFWLDKQARKRRALLRDVRLLIHVVRNPVYTIESLAKVSDSLEDAAQAFVARTRRIEQMAVPRQVYAVELGSAALAKIVGVAPRPTCVPTNYNQHVRGERQYNHLERLIADLSPGLGQEVRDVAKAYGYV
jgi:hypothetical protein